jgi:hypothetical protein
MVWVFDRTGSLLVAMLMHASLTATSMTLFGTLSDIQSVISILLSAGVWWVLVAVVALATRGQLWQQPIRASVAGDGTVRARALWEGAH